MLIAIEEQAEGIDVDKSAITIFDVNERITDMKKELNGIKGLREELKEIKHMLNSEQRQKLATEPTLTSQPQGSKHKVSLNEKLGTSPEETIRKAEINDEWNNN